MILILKIYLKIKTSVQGGEMWSMPVTGQIVPFSGSKQVWLTNFRVFYMIMLAVEEKNQPYNDGYFSIIILKLLEYFDCQLTYCYANYL